MKNKALVPIVLGLLILVGGTSYLFSQKKENKPQIPTEEVQEVIPTIDPDELGLSVTVRNDKRAIKFEIANSTDIQSVEYEISYIKMVDKEEVSEKLIGETELDEDTSKFAIAYREFGTCSSGVCRYDVVVPPVTVLLKITKKDGKVYQAQKTVDF